MDAHSFANIFSNHYWVAAYQNRLLERLKSMDFQELLRRQKVD